MGPLGQDIRNAQLPALCGLERHFIRGVLKMQVRVGLALVVMVAKALGSLQERRAGLMRSLVRAA